VSGIAFAGGRAGHQRGAGGITAALLLGMSGGPKIAPDVSLDQLIGYNLLIVAAILVLRVLFVIFRKR
jgi:ubiquinone biosynthesis protein